MNIRIKNLLLFLTLFLLLNSNCIFAHWAMTNNGGIFWVYDDNTYPVNRWELIDDDNDGIAYYYYFNQNGFVLLDDITPDYQIVNKSGRRIDFDGNEVAVNLAEVDVHEGNIEAYSEEILEMIKAEQYDSNVTKGIVSSGEAIISGEEEENSGPKPSDYIAPVANPNGTAQVLLGPNVTLKEEDQKYDPEIDRDLTKYVKSSDSKFSKKVNGTIFTQTKWKNVMALKGTGATVVFENPKNNFNKVKGRIATHYFSYSDRTTQCTLNIYNEDTGELIYTTSNFNYNGGCAFECTFYQSTNAIRFELDVIGQYTSRVCYLRNCEFGFDRETYEEEQYEKEVNEAYIAKYGEDVVSYDEEDYDDEGGIGEFALEGESPVDRYARIHGISPNQLITDYDIDDDSVTEEMRASISELRKQMELEDEKRNAISGPAFDEDLMNKAPALGPTGQTHIIQGKEGG